MSETYLVFAADCIKGLYYIVSVNVFFFSFYRMLLLNKKDSKSKSTLVPFFFNFTSLHHHHTEQDVPDSMAVFVVQKR